MPCSTLSLIPYSNPSSRISSISLYAKKCNNTLLAMKKYLVNSFDYNLSNGLVDDMNNVLKQIKHTAYGYRKFAHLKARVLLIKDIYNPSLT